MKKSLKVSLVKVLLSIVLPLLGYVSGYDTPLFYPLDWKNLKWDFNLGYYDITGNPAFFSKNYPENLSNYQISFGYKESPFRRIFDPAYQRNYRLITYNINHLSENITLGAFIEYNRSDLQKMSRSLEKDFYSEYFSIVDTTTGKTTFDGPLVGFVYSYHPTKNLKLGLKVDYGVEHGIKDVFTKCETIIRNLNLNGGLTLSCLNDHLILGINARYFNSQRKYEAVKELQDAQIKTYFGYHVYKLENPRSTNRKNDNREGFEISPQIVLENPGLPNLQILLATGFGAKATKVSVGSVSSPEPKGYSLSSGKRIIGNIKYKLRNNSFSLLYEKTDYEDWAEAGNYRVILLENFPQINRFRLISSFNATGKLSPTLFCQFELISDDYNEYVSGFKIKDKRNSFIIGGELTYRINPILTAFCNGSYSKTELFYFWPGKSLKIINLETGIDRLSLLGKFGFYTNFCLEEPNNNTKKNKSIGLTIFYKR